MFGDPRAWTLGLPIYNTLHLTHSNYLIKISTFLTYAYKSIFYSINTTYKADRLKAFAMFQARKMTFSEFPKMEMFLSTNVLGVSLSTDILARFVRLSSVTVDLWNASISLNLLKLRSTVLHTAVIGKLSLQWLQIIFHGRPEIFFHRGETSKFWLYFSGCWRCNVNGRSQSTCSILRQ